MRTTDTTKFKIIEKEMLRLRLDSNLGRLRLYVIYYHLTKPNIFLILDLKILKALF